MALTAKEKKIKDLYEWYLAKAIGPVAPDANTPIELLMAAILLEEYKDKYDALKAKE